MPHLELDPAAPQARRASELARELVGARLAGRDAAAVAVTAAIAEIDMSHPAFLAYVLVAQTTVTSAVLQGYEELARSCGWTGGLGDLFVAVAVAMAAQDITI